MCSEFEYITGVTKIRDQFSSEWSKWSTKNHLYAKSESTKGLKIHLTKLDTLDTGEHDTNVYSMWGMG